MIFEIISFCMRFEKKILKNFFHEPKKNSPSILKSN